MLEQALADLTKTVTRNNDLLEALLKSGKKDAGSEKSAKTEPAKDAAKPAETAKEGATESKGRKGKGKDADAAPKAPTVEDVHEVFSEFLGIDDQDERAKRKTFVKAILNELGAEKATLIPEESRAKAIQWVKDKLAGKKVSFDGEGEQEESLL
jgi:hypothetical protein